MCKDHRQVGLGGGRPAGFSASKRPKLLGHVSTGAGKGYGSGESQWRPNSWAGRPCGQDGRLPLAELPPRPSRWSSPMAL
jgi:hypothetical protein